VAQAATGLNGVMMKRKIPKPKSPPARALQNPIFRNRIKSSAKLYSRKGRRKISDGLFDSADPPGQGVTSMRMQYPAWFLGPWGIPTVMALNKLM
jgi:hypothetical protein